MAGDHANMRNLKSQMKEGKRKGRSKNTPTNQRNKVKTRTPKKLNKEYVIGFYHNLLLDITQLVSCYTLADFAQDFRELEHRITNEGTSFATKTLPVLSSGLFTLLESNTTNFPGFKLTKNAQYPQFLGRLFAIVHGNTYTNEISKEEEAAIKAIYQVSVAFKKVKGPYSERILKNKYLEFCAVDRTCGSLSFSDDDPILRTARSYMKTFISTIDLEDVTKFLPRPGPGATNTPTEKHERYEPHVLYKRINRVLPYAEWFYSHGWDVVDQSRTFLQLLHEAIDEPVSRFKFVQKKVDEPRGICIEENEVQYLQQGIRRGLQHFMSVDPLIGHRIVFHDQSVNAKLALSYSKTLEGATLDMSEASDRVMRDLVHYLFQDEPELHDILMALSTRFIEPSKDLKLLLKGCDPEVLLLQTNKFAPMGSALCFPIMSLVHFMLLRSIILHSAYPSCVQDSRQVWVYGDDIVIPSKYAQAVYEHLPKYGMKLNTSKSFYRSYFRESCGIHAYKGVNITPVFIKHTPKHRTMESLLSCLQVEQDLFKRDFYFTSGYLRVNMLKQFKYAKLHNCFVSPDSPVLGFKREHRALLTPPHIIKLAYKERVNVELQCFEYRVPVIEKLQDRKTIQRQCAAYLRWQVQKTEDSTHLRDSTTDLAIKWRWIPESALLANVSAL